MHPWKVFIRSVGVVTLLAMGGLAAGQNVVPFSNASRSVGALAEVDETATAPDGEVTPAVDETEAPADDSTTEAPPTAAPDLDPIDPPDTVPPVVDVTEAPDTPTTTAPPVPDTAPDSEAPTTPPTAPADEEGPVVCAAAAETACGPAEPELAADPSFDARVERCVAWWNRLADRLEERDRPRWAARARLIAERCDEWIARWQERREQREQERAQRREVRRDDRDSRKVKGDHNCDGHPDNGWRNKPGYPQPCPDRDGRNDNGRPGTAPGQERKAERHSERRR